MPVKLTLSRSIRHHRKRMSLTQDKAAERSGFRVWTWKQLESGHANPRLSTLEAVAFTLGVNMADLFTLPEETLNQEP